jgi:hypothetical protein
VELDKWWYPYATRQLIFFEGNDTLKTYPGGGGMTVSDALTDLYLRDSTAFAVTTGHLVATHRHKPVVKHRSHGIEGYPPAPPASPDTARWR